MNLKINKACDLNSISVLPPHARRRSSTVPSGPQASQHRSQPSQQSISPGFSSQPAFFSQNSLDEILTTDQRFCSQERENSVKKKVSCLPQTNTKREENQLAISRSSVNLMRKWNTSSVSEYRCKISEELEHRLGMIETSINRSAMILDSVQNDVMQVNKGTKEVLLENGIRQKLIAEDALLHLMNKGLEDIKTSLDRGMKSISDQLGDEAYLDKLQQIFLHLSTLPTQMEASLFKVKNELQNSLTKEIQAVVGSLKTLKPNSPVANAIPPKYSGSSDTLKRKRQTPKNQAKPSKPCVQSALPLKTEMRGWNPVEAEQSTSIGRPSFIPAKYTVSCDIPKRKLQLLKNPAMPSKACIQSAVCPATEMRGWNSVKAEQCFIGRSSFKEKKGKGISHTRHEGECRVIIESDEEIDEGFSCFLGEKERDTTISLSQEAKEETDRILRRARRQKRKYSNPITIN